MSQITFRTLPNFNKEFILTTDASSRGIGAILKQSNIHVGEYFSEAFSKSLDKSQINYLVTYKELLTLVKGIGNFINYSIGRPFILKPNHRSLQYLWTTKNTNSGLLRWALKLQEYSFTIKYIKGDENLAMDSVDSKKVA